MAPRTPNRPEKGGQAAGDGPPDARRGQQVGGHVLQRLLGRGAHGEVYLAHAAGATRPVALKLLTLPRGDAASAASQAFLDAAAAARLLQHPDIVAVYGAGIDHTTAWLSMEAIPGSSLERYTRHPRLLPEPLAVQIAQRLALALAHAHHKGVIHRDLKPANVLVDLPSGTVKLLDFGLARMADASQTATGLLLGSPAYMAPEQLAGGVPSPRTDLYALGATLFELLTGRPAFDAARMGDLLQQVAQQPAPDLGHLRPDLPAELAQLLRGLMAKLPADRPPHGEAVASVLQALAPRLAGSPAGSDAGKHPLPQQPG